MGYAELIERQQSLPREEQAEVFGFVEFLVVRSGPAVGKSIGHVDWTDAELSVMSMQQACAESRMILWRTRATICGRVGSEASR